MAVGDSKPAAVAAAVAPRDGVVVAAYITRALVFDQGVVMAGWTRAGGEPLTKRSVSEIACRTLTPTDDRVLSITVHQWGVRRPLSRVGETVQLMESGGDGTARDDVVSMGFRQIGAREVSRPGFASRGG